MSSTYTPQQIKDITERISILGCKWLRLVETRLSASQRLCQTTTEQPESSDNPLSTGSKLERQFE
jgi:hypothetical protein